MFLSFIISTMLLYSSVVEVVPVVRTRKVDHSITPPSPLPNISTEYILDYGYVVWGMWESGKWKVECGKVKSGNVGWRNGVMG